jgi:peptidoglycan/xylan/chitin deacetylase (PgdA/CDA1 family)
VGVRSTVRFVDAQPNIMNIHQIGFMHNFTHAIMFHHLHDEKKHSQGQGSISSDEFEQILEYAKSKYNLLDADAYEAKVIGGNLGETDVVLTFDDALKSQYEIAYPILAREGIKAYFFVYTNAFSEEPDPLEFYRDYRNNYFGDIDEFYAQFFRIFLVTQPDLFSDYSSRYPNNYLSAFPFYTDMDRRFRFARDEILGIDNYYAIMDSMMTDSGYNKEERRSTLFMSKEDIASLSNSGHAIGLHSSSHPTRMDGNSYKRQLTEYTDNFDFLHSLTGIKPTSMSHPCGRYNADTLKILSDIGIKIGFCSSIEHSNIRSCFEIPREDHANVIKFLSN